MRTILNKIAARYKRTPRVQSIGKHGVYYARGRNAR